MTVLTNALTCSQVRALLEQIEATHGDIDVVLAISGQPVAVDPRNVNVISRMGSRTFPQPVLAFGMTRARNDVLTNSPGEAYMGEAQEGDWRTDLSAAPAGETVDIYRRGTGADTGYVVEGQWFAFDGGDRAWRLAAPPLYWKPRA